ncbi:MAG: tetratricopeptide repeat protein [Elainella sp. Prado103]|nr:tetratricopeptide repeat protein [Elainella sp. Prado103]
MFNPFRNFSAGTGSQISIAPANRSKLRLKSAHSPRKGFFQRFFEVSEFFWSDLPSRSGNLPETMLASELGIADLDHFTDGLTTSLDATGLNATLNASLNATLDENNGASNSPELVIELLPRLLEQGEQAAQRGDWAMASNYYHQAVQLCPDRTDLYPYLAETLTQQDKLAEAASYYRRAIELAQAKEFQSAALQGTETACAAEMTALEMTALEAIPPETVPPEANSLQSSELQEQRVEPVATTDPEAFDLPWFEQASFHLQQAMVNCNAGDWQATIEACQVALEHLEPEAALAYLLMGRSLQGQQQFATAAQFYQKSLALQPQSAEAHARLGSLYAQQSDFQLAVPHYQMAVQIDPSFAGAYWKLSEAWQQLGELESSVTCLDEAFRLEPAWSTAIEDCQLADRLQHLGKLDRAIACYERAIQKNPQLPVAYLGLGAVYGQQDRSTPIAIYQQGIQHNPACVDLAIRLGDQWADSGDWLTAQTYYQQGLAHEPNHPVVLAGIRRCCFALQQWDQALAVSQQLVELQPQDAEHWHQLGDNFSRLQRWQEAIESYQQAIDRNPTCSWSHNNLADAWLQLEQWDAAIEPLRTAIVLNPDFVWSHYNLGEALTQLQDWDGAIEAYRSALRIQPDLPYAAGRLADALHQRAMLDQDCAFTFYRQAIQQNPHDPDPYYRALELQPDAVPLYLGLSDALAVQARWDEALTCCQIARQLQPTDPDIIAKLKQLLQQQTAARQPQSQADAYERWMAIHTPTPDQLEVMRSNLAELTHRPVISVIMPVYNPSIAFLQAAIRSVCDQVYPDWELCIADDASADLEVLELLNQWALADSRIKVVFRAENGHIAAASNSALALATGQYVAFLDQDDQLAPEALYEVVSLLNQHPEADLIYSDEDKLDTDGKRQYPFFKPDWCPDSFLSRMYTCHLGVYRRDLVEAIGGFRLGFAGSQDYDLVLRLTEQTNRIFHLPKVLYHWRMHPTSTASSAATKPYAAEAAQRAIQEALQRRGELVRTVEMNPEFPGVYIPRFEIREHQRVSIIIPTRNFGEMLDRCLQSIFDQTTYPNYEVILIDNGSQELETQRVLEKWQQIDRVHCHRCDIPFNYSKLNNLAVPQSQGHYLLFLNNDTEVITPDWIEAMVEQAQRPAIGAVGALLLYPDQTVQHAGVVLGIGDIAGHSHKYYRLGDHGYFSQLVSVNNYSAVTAACLLCRREVFEQVGGFDEAIAVAFNDVDFCLKLKQQGYRNLYLPHVMLYHHESKSRGIEDTLEKQQRFTQELELMKARWQGVLRQDECYSPHLSLTREDYSLRV